MQTAKEIEKRDCGLRRETPPARKEEATGKQPGPQATCVTVTGAVTHSAAASDPPRCYSALIHITVNKQELLAYLDT